MYVTMDLFSGRENPSWRMTGDELRRLASRIPDQVPHRSAYAQESTLGFRGFILNREVGDPPLFPAIPQILRIGREELLDEIPVLVAADANDLLLEIAGTRCDTSVLDAVQECASFAHNHEDRHFTSAAGAAADDLQADGQGEKLLALEDAADATPVLAPYRPVFWNQPAIRLRNNCYNYAANFASNTVAQPGRVSGKMFQRFTCASVRNASFSDGVIDKFDGTVRIVALGIWPGIDFHWWRLHPGGLWAHKLGLSTARNGDNSGRVIAGGLTPENCNRFPYTEFCGYYYVPIGVSVL